MRLRSVVAMCGAIALAALGGTAFAGDLGTVKYPSLYKLGTKSQGYVALEMALSKSGETYKLELLDRKEQNQARALIQLREGEIDIVDTGYSPDYAKEFDPIMIPIDRGLTGWRIFIIHKDSAADFAAIKTLDQLRAKTAGQGSDWADVAILKANGINVMTSSLIENLVKMTAGKRFDFFPLGANEAHAFLRESAPGEKDLTVENSIVMRYPFGKFFFVKKGNTKLAEAVTKGLEAAYADGSFQKFFDTQPFLGESLKEAGMEKRTIIDIDNPFSGEAMKMVDPKWWYTVAK